MGVGEAEEIEKVRVLERFLGQGGMGWRETL